MDSHTCGPKEPLLTTYLTSKPAPFSAPISVIIHTVVLLIAGVIPRASQNYTLSSIPSGALYVCPAHPLPNRVYRPVIPTLQANCQVSLHLKAVHISQQQICHTII